METKLPQLMNWSVMNSNTNHAHLVGYIYDDDRFPEGNIVTTSRIQKVSRVDEGYYISTRNTTYYCESQQYYNGSYTCASVMDQLMLEEE